MDQSIGQRLDLLRNQADSDTCIREYFNYFLPWGIVDLLTLGIIINEDSSGMSAISAVWSRHPLVMYGTRSPLGKPATPGKEKKGEIERKGGFVKTNSLS